MNILLVDDDKMYREALAMRLELKGHKVIQVTGVKQALDELRVEDDPSQVAAAHFDLVVTDGDMPGQNGVELARLMRGLSAAPIVMISGNPNLEASFLAAGGEKFFDKLDSNPFFEWLGK